MANEEGSFYRQAVLNARRNQWLGGISLSQPRRTWAITGAAVGLGLGVVAFLVSGTYTQRSRVQGQLAPAQGLASVLAPATGVMEQVRVSEGDSVRAQQPLGVVRVARMTLGHGEASTALRGRIEQRRASVGNAYAAQEAKLRVDESSLRIQRDAAQRELRQLEVERQTRRAQAALANEVLERMQRLQSQRYVSDIQIKLQEAAALDRISAAQEIERQATALTRTTVELEQALVQIPVQRASSLATYHGELASLGQEEIGVETDGALAVGAPTAGLVTSQVIKPGQAVQAGQPLFTLLPNGSALQAELLVPSRAIANLRPGGAVLLRYEAFPYQKFGHQLGRIAHISRSALTPAETKALDLSGAADQPVYRVIVALDRQSVVAYGREEPLRPGMAVEADLLGDTRHLYEWLFEPMYALSSQTHSPSNRR